MRFTAELRGEDFKDEWCVVDEHIGIFGTAVLFGLTEENAKDVARYLNSLEEED